MGRSYVVAFQTEEMQGVQKQMKIKSKPAVKTVSTKKTRTAVKKATPKAAAKPIEKAVTFTVRAEAG